MHLILVASLFQKTKLVSRGKQGRNKIFKTYLQCENNISTNFRRIAASFTPSNTRIKIISAEQKMIPSENSLKEK